MTKLEFRQAVLQNAVDDIGQGEEGENNWGPWVEGLLQGVGIDFPASWCAAAVWSWMESALSDMGFSQSTITDSLIVGEIKTPSAKAMFNACRTLGWLVTDPQPGDLIFFKRPGESWYAHVGIVVHVGMIEKEKIWTIEGNKGPFPARVKRYEYTTPIDKLIGYARLLGE